MGEAATAAPALRECPYCGRQLKTAKGYDKHAQTCARRKEIEANGGLAVKRAYELFNHWFAYNRMSRKPKSFESFLRSPYRGVFLDVDGLVTRTYVISGKSYLEWLSDHRVPARDWCKDSVMRRYKLEHSREQDPETVTVRNLEVMARWCDAHGVDVADFFSSIGPGDALVWIESGSLTPWVMMNTPKLDDLLERMDDLQQEQFCRLVDIGYWDARLKVSPETPRVREILSEMGL